MPRVRTEASLEPVHRAQGPDHPQAVEHHGDGDETDTPDDLLDSRDVEESKAPPPRRPGKGSGHPLRVLGSPGRADEAVEGRLGRKPTVRLGSR